MTRVIFVDDDRRVLEGLRRLVRRFSAQWQFEFFDDPGMALEHIKARPPDVVVSDIRMPGIDGVELLTRVQQEAPATIRIAFSGQCDRAAVLRAVKPTHQFLAKPCDPEVLRRTLVRLGQLRDRVLNDDIRAEISRMAALPVLPESLAVVKRALTHNDVSVSTVAKLVSADVGMCAKIMQLVSSNFFSMEQTPRLPEQAVRTLGLDVLKPLFLDNDVFVPMELEEDLRPLSQFYSQVCRAVALAAQRIAEAENAPQEFCVYSYLGGLFAKVGVMIYAGLDLTKYEQVFRLAIEGHGTLRQLETQVYGVSRSQAAAYLFALWGLPDPVVEALMYLHRPMDGAKGGFQPLTAVHVADALVGRFVEIIAGRRPPLDEEYLQAIGLINRLPVWESLVKEVVEKLFGVAEGEKKVWTKQLLETRTVYD